MTLEIGSSRLTLEDVERVARGREKIALTTEALARIRVCRGMLEEKIAAGEIMYGVNTGIGEFSEVVLSPEQLRDFQKYLIYNHSAGIGEPVSEENVRAAMLGRIAVHSHGHSGCRPEITQTLVSLLNAGVTPVVCEKGSVGACGDLATMSQIALCLMGEGETFYQGERLPAKEAMSRAGITVPGLEARDGLATINGS
ncbi:MAG: aromatic amino acid lyase, partial [Gemmatimonadales bacterium]